MRYVRPVVRRLQAQTTHLRRGARTGMSLAIPDHSDARSLDCITPRPSDAHLSGLPSVGLVLGSPMRPHGQSLTGPTGKER